MTNNIITTLFLNIYYRKMYKLGITRHYTS